jgi:hypothetical protein
MDKKKKIQVSIETEKPEVLSNYFKRYEIDYTQDGNIFQTEITSRTIERLIYESGVFRILRTRRGL